MIAMLLSKDADVDGDKAVKMALVHDLAEAIVGDITPHDNVSVRKKHELEKEAMVKMFGDSEPFQLWKEYESQESKEAVFVKDVDVFEALLQAREYEQKYGIDLSEFYEYAKINIRSDFVRKLARKIIPS
jgi:putative hydrolase of HD superfamily